MGDTNSAIFIEDVVLYAMSQSGRNWKRPILNIKGDDPHILGIFTPEFGKAVLYCAMLESWSYIDVVDFLVQELLHDKTCCAGRFMHYLRTVGLEYLDLNSGDTWLSYCGMIVEVCCYCFDREYTSLIEAAIFAASMAMNQKLEFLTDTDRARYYRYAIQYNKVYECTFLPGEQNLALETLIELGNELPIIQSRMF